MRAHILLTRILPALLALFLGACNPTVLRPEGGDDETGDLGTSREERPSDIYAKMGEEYLKDGQPAVALRKLKRGMELDPDNARIHAVLGTLYDRLGETPKAEIHYRRAIELSPKNPYYHNAMGSFLCQREHYQEADEEFQRALQNPLYDTPWAANSNAGVCAYRAGKLDQAETYLRRALSANPQVPLALAKLAQLSYERGNFPAAKEYLQRYQGVAPPSPETLWLAIRVERKLGDTKAALNYQTELRARFPDAPENQYAKESK